MAFVRRVGVLSFLAFVTVACGGSDSNDNGGGGGGSPSNPSNPSAAGSGSATCGSETCDGAKSYCELSASKDADGNTKWTPVGCKPIPSGCALPAPPESCQPSGDCTQFPPPPSCTAPPDTEKCSPSKFCDCVTDKSASCPKSGLIVTKCQGSNGLYSVGCSG